MRDKRRQRDCTIVCPHEPWPARTGGLHRVAELAKWLKCVYRDVAIVALEGDTGRTRIDIARPAGAVRSRPTRLVLSIPRLIPPQWARYYHPYVKRTVETAVADGRDVIICHPYMMVNVRRSLWSRVIVDSQNLEMLRSNAGGPMRRLSTAYEARVLRSVRLFTVCAEYERRAAREAAPSGRIALVPNGAPVQQPQPLGKRNTAYFIGKMDYAPNVDAVRWLVQEIWPRILRAAPSASLRVFGSGNPASVRGICEGAPRVTFEGEVENAIDALRDLRLCVVPVRSGGGTRIKILEAAALGKVVVSTSAGAAGLECIHDRAVLADEADTFAVAAARLLLNDREAAERRARLVSWAADRQWSAVFDRYLLPHLGLP